jgi:hypothetical protein
MRIISFIDQPDVIKNILEHLGLWEESEAPPDRNQGKKVITFDPPTPSSSDPFFTLGGPAMSSPVWKLKAS